MSFSFKHARYFVATARSGQVSRAAVELNVSQSAVTAAIQHLEDLLGVLLFERRAQGMSLTHAGSRFLAHAEHIVAAVSEAARAAAFDAAEPSGRLRVGVTYTVSGYFIGPLLSRLRRALPQVEVDLWESERTELEAALVAGELDLAILLTSNLVNCGNILFETLVRSTRRVWLSDGHPLAGQPSLSLAEVASQPYIALTVDEALDTQRKYWRAAGVEPQVIFSTNSVEAVRTMVGSGLGVTVLSDIVYRPWSLDGARIETRNLATPVPSLDIGIAWTAQKPRSLAATRMIAYLRHALGSDARTR